MISYTYVNGHCNETNKHLFGESIVIVVEHLPGHPEVADFHSLFGIKQTVSRSQISVNEVHFVKVGQTVGDVERHLRQTPTSHLLPLLRLIHCGSQTKRQGFKRY